MVKRSCYFIFRRSNCQDADRLDAIGAIGVARTFQFAGHFGEPMWTEQMSLDKINDDLVEQLPPSAIKHFFEKLLKLESLMHTDTAKMIAKERHDFMMMCLKQFYGMELSRLDIGFVV